MFDFLESIPWVPMVELHFDDAGIAKMRKQIHGQMMDLGYEWEDPIV